MTDYTVLRDYRGSVLVAPDGAEPVTGEWRTSKDGRDYFYSPRKDVEKYKRASDAGKHLKGGGDGLANWKAAMAAIGVVMSDSARSQVANLINEYDGDPYYAGDDGGWRSGKKRLQEAVELACEVAGSSTASSRGSEFHKLGEMINKGRKPTIIQSYLADHLTHYRERVEPIEFIQQETLIVNDRLKRAGSVDYHMRLPAGLTTPDGAYHDDPLDVVGDLKTGRWDRDYPAGLFAQLATYGRGSRYIQKTNERIPLNVDQRWGVLVHYPIASPGATVRFYWVDLEIGEQAAELNNELDAMIKFFQSDKGKPVEFLEQ